MTRQYLFTSESVSEGHPDKLADLISDTLLDAFLARDPQAKVVCETFLANELIVIGGEFRTSKLELIDEIADQAPSLVRQTLREVGYRSDILAIDPERCVIQPVFNLQSEDIHQGVERESGAIGAGDQGLMFGYACDETPELMPLPLSLAHRLMQRQAEVRKAGFLPWLRPDAKSQVTVCYQGDHPVSVEKVVLSSQHAPEVSPQQIRDGIIQAIIEVVIPPELRAPEISYLINPTGRFEIGGPRGDTGLTGRKIIADTYGGSCPHGGGAFSGKDPTKVDRSASYLARYIAKNIVAAGLTRRCTVQLAYAIGMVEPVSVHVNLHGTGWVDEAELEEVMIHLFDLTPQGIIDALDLRRPIYRKTAAYGHFGRALPEFTWERRDRAETLRAHFRDGDKDTGAFPNGPRIPGADSPRPLNATGRPWSLRTGLLRKE